MAACKFPSPLIVPRAELLNPHARRCGFARRCLVLVLAALVVMSLGGRPGVYGAETRLVPLEGKPHTATIVSIEATGAVRTAQGEPTLLVNDLQALEPLAPQPLAPAETTCLVEFAGGGRWPARAIVSRGDALEIRSAVGNFLWLVPLDSVRAIFFGAQAPNENLVASAAAPNAEHDRVFLNAEGQVQPLPGLFERLTAEALFFSFEGEVRTLERNRVVALVFAGTARLEPAKFLVTAGEGQTLSAQGVALAGDELRLTLQGGGTVALPWQQITRLEIRSNRLAFVSDLKPTDERQETLVAPKRPWQRDRGITGRPLQILERTYAKGLGVQAGTHLTFETRGEYATFAAEIGIDASALGHGDCEFVVLGDGRELSRQRMRGAEEARELRVDISGCRQVTLAVEAGAELDLADHADWANARILKPAAPLR